MDKDSKIWELPDGEFLNFLYNERNREFSKHSNWGVNFWVASASIIALLAYAYHSISVDYELFNWRLVVYYCTVIFTLMIIGVNLCLLLIKHDRWINTSHITTIYKNAPNVAIFGKIMILIFLVVSLKFYKDFGIVFYLILFLLIIEYLISIYISINSHKIVKVDYIGTIFSNLKLEILYRITELLVCLSIIISAVYIWGPKYCYGIKEFEISFVYAIIVGIIWLMFYRLTNNRSSQIDWWIEQYLYGSLSKYDVYIFMYEYSQGNDVVDIIYKEHKKLKSMVTMIKKREGELEEYRNIIASENLCYDDIPKYFSFIQKELVICKESIDIVLQVKNKISKTQEFLKYSSSLELYSKLFECVIKDTEYIFCHNDKCWCFYEELGKYIDPYICKTCGKLCDKTECKYRNLKLPFYKRWLLKLYLKWDERSKRKKSGIL